MELAVINKHRMFYLLLSVWLLLFHHTIIGLVTTWSVSNTYGHGFLIAPIVIWLIYRERVKLAYIEKTPSIVGLLAMCVVSVGWFVSSLSYINVAEQFSFFLLPVTIIWAYYGLAMVKALAFPLAFLFLSIPVGDFLIPYLQFSTADIAVKVLSVLNVPVFRDGMYIQIPNGNFHVAEACSGIRFLISTVTIGILLAYLNFDKLYKQLLFIVFCVAVAIFGNGLRAFLMILIGYLSNMKAAVGFDHIVYGWVFFSFLLIIVFGVGNYFADDYKKTEHTEQNSTIINKQPAMSFVALMIASLAFGALLQYPYYRYVQQLTIQDAPFIHQKELSEALISADIHSNWQPLFPHADIIKRRQFNSSNQQPIDVLEISYLFEQNGKELISYENQLFDPEKWSLQSIGTGKVISKTGITLAYNRFVITSLSGQTREIRVVYKVGNRFFANKLAVKLWQLLNKISFHDLGGKAIIVSMPIESGSTEQLDAFMQRELIHQLRAQPR